MMKKGVCFILCFMLGLSMIAPAFVRAASPGLQPDIMTPEMWMNLQYLVTSMGAGASVQVAPGVAPSQIVSEYSAPLPYQSRAYKVEQSLRKQLSQAILDGEIDHLDASFNMDDLNNLVSYDWGKYVDLGYSVSASAIPDYVPDEFRAQLSYLNTWDDLNLWHRMVLRDNNKILLSGNEVDLSKFFYCPGTRYSWYYDLNHVRHGLLYYFNNWDDCLNYSLYHYNMNLPYDNAFYSFEINSDSNGGRYPNVEVTNDRVKLLLSNDRDWGNDDFYSLNIVQFNGNNSQNCNLYPVNTTYNYFSEQGNNYSYRNVGSDDIYTGGPSSYEGIAISDYNVMFISNAAVAPANVNFTIVIDKHSDDKLLDTISTLSEYMRNVDIYIGSDWSNAQPWYAEPEQPDISVTFPEPETIDGDDTPVVAMKVPQAGVVDLAKVWEWLQSLFENDELDDNPLTIDDIPEDCFPDPDNNRQPSPLQTVTPAEAAMQPQPEPLPNPGLYPYPVPASNTLDPDAILPMYLPVNKFSGLLWSRPLYNSEYMTGDVIPDDAPSTSSPVHAAVELFQALDATCNGFLSTYLVVTISAFIVMAFVIKLLHG